MKIKYGLIPLLLGSLSLQAAPIQRQHGEILFPSIPVRENPPPQYPWRMDYDREIPRITKEHFRCRGSRANSIRVAEADDGSKLYLEDCGGVADHSLPLRNGEEFIYEILIEVLNKVQEATGKKVVITSGHRCPLHNTYIDPSVRNSKSKHQLGAAATFYVEGFEDQPQDVLKKILQEYPDLTQSEEGWGNKEFFVKIYWSHEGRDGDNSHIYPYLSVQVRFDRKTNQRVEYSWKTARQPLYRW